MIDRPAVIAEPEAAPPARAASSGASGGAGLDDPRALLILTTEHSNLQSTRSMLWNESYARTALFLSSLSASVIALSLIGTSRPDFPVFALTLLPVTLFIGVATFVRLDDSNRQEILWVVAMNRIRNAYLAIVPEVADRFVSGTTDDLGGIVRSYGLTPDTRYSVTHFFVTIPGMVAVVDGVIAAAMTAIALVSIDVPSIGLPIGAAAAGVGTTLALGRLSKRRFDSWTAAQEVLFP